MVRHDAGEIFCHRLGLALVLAGLVAAYAATLATVASEPLTDFPTFYVAARHALEGKDIYAQDQADLGLLPPTRASSGEPLNPNLNPPFQTLLMAPLGLVDYATAFWLWSLVSLALLVAGAMAVESASRNPGATAWRMPGLVVMLLAYFPTWASFVYGQFGLALFGLLALVWFGARNRREVLAGVSLGLALSLKPFAAIFLLLYMLRRRWRLLAAAVATATLCALVALVAFGWAPYAHYLGVLGGANWHAASWNASFLGFFGRIFGGSRNLPLVDVPGLAQVLAAAGSATILGALVWLAEPRRQVLSERRLDLAFALAVLAMLLVSPLGWMYYFPSLAIPVLVLWREGCRWPAVAAWVLSSVPHLLVPSARFNDPLGWFTWAGFYFYALVIFALLIVRQARRQAEEKDPAGGPAGSIFWREAKATTGTRLPGA